MQNTQLRFGGRDYISRQTDVSKYGKTSVVSFFRPLHGEDHGIHIVKKDFLALKNSSVSNATTRYKTELKILQKLAQHRNLCNLYPFILGSSFSEGKESFILLAYSGITLTDFFKRNRDTIHVDDIRSIEFQMYFGYTVLWDIFNIRHSDATTNLDNYCIETTPCHSICSQIFRIEIAETEYIQIEFQSPYIVTLIDFASDQCNGDKWDDPIRFDSSRVIKLMERTTNTRSSSNSNLSFDSEANAMKILKCLAQKLSQWKVEAPGFYVSNKVPACSFWALLDTTFLDSQVFTTTKSFGKYTEIMKDGISLGCVKNIYHKQAIVPLTIREKPINTHQIKTFEIQPNQLKRKWSSDKVRMNTNYKLGVLREKRTQENYGERSQYDIEIQQLEEMKEFGDVHFTYFKNQAITKTELSFIDSDESYSLVFYPCLFDTKYVSVQITGSTGDKSLGVFAMVEISKGILFTKYEGPILFSNDCDSWPREFKTHLKSLEKGKNGTLISGLQRPIPCLGVGSLVNSSSECANAKFKHLDKKQEIYLESIRTISKGEEIFVDYVVI